MDRARVPFYLPTIFTFVALIVAFLVAPARIIAILRVRTERVLSAFHPPSAGLLLHDNMASTRTPVYFLSHGGPNIMYNTDHPVYPELQEIGKEIVQKVKPKGIVVFSAHWQGESDMIEVNTAEKTDLIYDYYGFPAHYYTATFPNKGSPELAQKVIALLATANIKTSPTTRGLDHGVFAVFNVAFHQKSNPLTIPIVQVSLFDSENPGKHYALGQALSSLRDEGILLIMSGMAVHNLRDMRLAMGRPGPMDYSLTFDEALREAVEAEPETREEKMAALLKRGDARRAHPTFEHLLPIFVGAGAAGGDRGKRLWTLPEWSFSWAQYRFGNMGGKV